MYFALEVQLRRQADGPLDGSVAWLLFPLYVFLCGTAVPAALVVGANLARVPWLWLVGIAAAAGGLVTGLVIFPDDHAGLHVAILWVSTILAGASVAPLAERRLEARPRARRALVVGASVVGIAALAISPPNDVRVQLFREPGAVAPWILARTVWRPPALDLDADVPPPPSEPYPDALLEEASSALAPAPVVVLVTVDALRADVLRDHPERFGALTRLCDEGACFARAVAGSSGTTVSLTTLFSSRWFSQLRWERFGTGRERFSYPVADESPRLAELLDAAGVETASVLPLTFLSSENGVARGFALEQIVAEPRHHGHANRVVPPILEVLSGIETSRASSTRT